MMMQPLIMQHWLQTSDRDGSKAFSQSCSVCLFPAVFKPRSDAVCKYAFNGSSLKHCQCSSGSIYEEGGENFAFYTMAKPSFGCIPQNLVYFTIPTTKGQLWKNSMIISLVLSLFTVRLFVVHQAVSCSTLFMYAL